MSERAQAWRVVIVVTAARARAEQRALQPYATGVIPRDIGMVHNPSAKLPKDRSASIAESAVSTWAAGIARRSCVPAIQLASQDLQMLCLMFPIICLHKPGNPGLWCRSYMDLRDHGVRRLTP